MSAIRPTRSSPPDCGEADGVAEHAVNAVAATARTTRDLCMLAPNVTVNVARAQATFGIEASQREERPMPDRRPTIRDVAQAAGVSAMSVSRVLNGRPGVGAETARRIEETMRALGYRPNMLAANLRQQRGVSLIGMIVPDPYTPLFTS